ncbi:DNA helicase B isoform X2 [Hemicordylus capensis]|uniref:DNA helicase B isoform X2 n=1 Tax=Hemicordylus capensis TaxID=884348 RepID=UPI0023048DD8|nr:DNA helicase B isoform X2 [Hemicordylus capensis]
MAGCRREPGKRGSFELWGLLLPLKTKGADEEDDEQEEDGDDADADFELPDAARADPDQTAPRQKVIIQEEKSQAKYQVAGRFLFTDSWWKVNVKVKKSGPYYYVQGYPSYFLQTDAGENQISIISLFFNACNVPPEFISEFFEWLPEGSSLNFMDLEEILNQFQESKLQEGQKSADTKLFDIFNYIKNSFAGKAVLVALAFPAILEFLPILLPRNISHCIGWLNSKDVELTKLNKILKEEPWKLGFSTMVYRDLRTSFSEVSWSTFSECSHLLEKIPDLQKNALKIYAAFKQRCSNKGHTYEEQDKLTRMVSEDMSVEHAWQSLQFMKDERILVSEGKLFFLYNLYKAEKEIATTVHELIKKTPWQLHADVKKALSGRTHMNTLRDPVVEYKINDEEPCGMDQEEPSNTSDMQENCNDGFECGARTPREEIKIEVVVDPNQEKAVEMICANPVTVISGRGGCGKTTVVSYLFRYLKEMEEKTTQNACKAFEADTANECSTFSQCFDLNERRNESLNILFTAPTGRAARLLQKKTQISAYTLHQVIWSYYAWKHESMPWKFSEVNVLVVDEGSLVSVEVLSRVLHLLFHHACLAKLIILGDVRQLPSIKPGNMLADMFEIMKSRSWGLELRTNHRTESQLIVDNALRISRQIYPEFDALLTISGRNDMWPVPSPEKRFILVALPTADDLVPAIKALLERGPGLEDAKQSQFISFRRKDCDIINEICCQHYSHHPMRNHKNQLQFQCGDKACSTRNAYIRDLQRPVDGHDDRQARTGPQGSSAYSQCAPPAGCPGAPPHSAAVNTPTLTHPSCSNPGALPTQIPPPSQCPQSVSDDRLCNGDIFFIKKDEEDKHRFLTINIPDGEEYTLLYTALRRISKIKHAWARTIHTFQGSEENTVVYVVGNSPYQHWQHVYTAITRGRSRVYIVAEEAQLRTAIARKSFSRKTQLRKYLKDALVGKMDDSEQTLLPQRSWNFALPDENRSTDEEERGLVSDEMENDNGLEMTVELAGVTEDTSLHPGELKRQCEFPDGCESPFKVPLVIEDNSPLGTTKLLKMTLKDPVPKQLFK